MTTDHKNILGDDMILLSDVAEPVFNLTERIAQRKASTNTLPIAAFRINGTRKGPLYVMRQDLEKWIKEQADRAKAQHLKMQSV